jgi:hypothetical protein
MWSDAIVNKYLGNLDSFENLYCREDTASVDGTLQRANGIGRDCLRKIIYKLAKAMPSAAHSSPGWDYNNLPIIKIGIKHKDYIPGELSCGLLLVDGKLHFWINNTVKFDGYDFMDKRFWAEYIGSNPAKKVNKCYYLKPLDCNSDFDQYLKALMDLLSAAQNEAFHAYCDKKPKERAFIFTDQWVPRNAA